MGPWIVTGLNPDDLRVTIRLNGKEMFTYAVKDAIFGVRQFISRMSQYLTLYPGRRAVDGHRRRHREHEGRRPGRGRGAGDRRAPQPGRERTLIADHAFPIVRRPPPGTRTPVLVSVPHYGTEPLPHITRDHYSEPWFETFAYGFADTFVGDLYGDLHEHGATVLATPFSRMFVDVNRRRDDFEHHDGEVRSRRGVVRTHTMREAPIFRAAARPRRSRGPALRAATTRTTRPSIACSASSTSTTATRCSSMATPAARGG